MERKTCVICDGDQLEDMLDSDLDIPQSCQIIETGRDALWMPYNISFCKNCYAFQTKYLADLNELYGNSHIFPIGTIRSSMDIKFSNFIISNTNINGIIEIGGGQGTLCDQLLENFTFTSPYSYTIIDPSYTGNKHGRSVLPYFCEDKQVDFENIKANTVIMSHVFEHFYQPRNILEMLYKNKNINYLYLCHPDFDTYVSGEPYTLNVLHAEHTFFIDNQVLIHMMESIGFSLIKQEKHEGYCVFFEFARCLDETANKNKQYCPQNILARTAVPKFIKHIQNKVKYINALFHDLKYIHYKKYVWPCSIHSVMLTNFGLDYDILDGFLDNAPSKIGKYMYGYDIPCFSFRNTIDDKDQKSLIVLNGGCFNKEIMREKFPDNILIITYEQ